MTKPKKGRQTPPNEKRAKSLANSKKATSGTLPEMTADEEAVFHRAVAQRGRAWAEQHVNLILDQARQIGNL